MIDEPLVRFTERALVRFQDVTGIPKWKAQSQIWCLYFVVSSIGRFSIGRTAFVVFMIVAWSWNPDEKDKQGTADRCQQIVPNEQRYSLWGRTTRWIALVLCPLGIMSGAVTYDWTFIVGDLTFFVATYLNCLNTFPMVGPTFKERLRGFFGATHNAPARETGITTVG